MTTKHAKHHRRMHMARSHSTRQERAETQKLNQDELAKAQGASQGQYGTSEPQPSNTPAPSTSNDTGGPNTAPPSDTPQPNNNNQTTTPNGNNTTMPAGSNPQAPNPSTPPQK